MGAYMNRVSLGQFRGKTFDDTLAEVVEAGIASPESGGYGLFAGEDDRVYGEIPDDIRDFWGGSFTNEFYRELQKHFDEWAKRYEGFSMTVEETAVIKQLCIAEALINQKIAANEDIGKLQSSYNALLGSANLRPIQRKADEATSIDNMPIGLLIKLIENERPIKEVDPDLADVDGIGKYIKAWFIGPLSRLFGFKQIDTSAFEEEAAKYTITKSNFEEDGESSAYEKIFGANEGGGDET
jgi:hypothetical protein